MPGNTNQHTAAATVRVGASSGDGADLSTHFHLVGEGGAGDAMQECDSAGAGDPSTTRFTGECKPAANHSRKWFQYASVTGWDRHEPDDVSVFDVWHISHTDMSFGISARIVVYHFDAYLLAPVGSERSSCNGTHPR